MGRQESVVLPYPSPWMPTDCSAADAHPPNPSTCAANIATAACRSLQLQRWLRELAGGLECGKERMVLQGSWKGVPKPGRWVRDLIRAIRLRCWFRQLDGGVVCA